MSRHSLHRFRSLEVTNRVSRIRHFPMLWFLCKQRVCLCNVPLPSLASHISVAHVTSRRCRRIKCERSDDAASFKSEYDWVYTTTCFVCICVRVCVFAMWCLLGCMRMCVCVAHTCSSTLIRENPFEIQYFRWRRILAQCLIIKCVRLHWQWCRRVLHWVLALHMGWSVTWYINQWGAHLSD